MIDVRFIKLNSTAAVRLSAQSYKMCHCMYKSLDLYR